ncbi:XTP/dITP diphosphatase [Thalassotalea agarivorans]|nr:XTP/dITP diphosphatase [Thalassotalea agarivorans]
MQKIVLATGNQGKVKEMASLLAERGYTVLPQSEFNVVDAEETGTTFIENAIIKARHAAKITGLATIADDSGLEVDALNGAPGIYSARYSGEDASDSDNITKLLTEMADIPEQERTARFHCVLVYMKHALDPTPLVCHGTWEGRITSERSGDEGFGYDPVFWVDDMSKTAAQLSKAEKHALSHRGKALKQLFEHIS